MLVVVQVGVCCKRDFQTDGLLRRRRTERGEGSGKNSEGAIRFLQVFSRPTPFPVQGFEAFWVRSSLCICVRGEGGSRGMFCEFLSAILKSRVPSNAKPSMYMVEATMGVFGRYQQIAVESRDGSYLIWRVIAKGLVGVGVGH